MIEPFSYDDTQFVADTINRDTVERAHAILTGLVERGWTPPPASCPGCEHLQSEHGPHGCLHLVCHCTEREDPTP